MKIVINHLTRMKPGYICVAGINLENHQHVRPILPTGISRAFLVERGGFFELGRQIDLGWVQYDGRAPEIEDYKFEAKRVRGFSQFSPTNFWQLINKVSHDNLSDIFGSDLTQMGNSAVVPIGKGQASLGSLRISYPLELKISDEGYLRTRLVDDKFEVDVSITDYRFYEANNKTLILPIIEEVNEWAKSSPLTIASVGLTRPWPKTDNPRHWLQINNLHFQNNPLW